MRTPRYKQIRPDTAQCFHITSRCVRRAFLCGEDKRTGINYDYRKSWIEHRLIELARHFAVGVHAYAIMSNHFHVSIEVDPTHVENWSDEDVAQRWLMLTAAKRLKEAGRQQWLEQLLGNPAKLKEIRERLGSVSWFMGLLKAPIARRANKEDDCKGHFWEGRFEITESLDDEALLSQMIYIDLNPMRAGIAADPILGPNTSAARRARRHEPGTQLEPLAGCVRSALPPITEHDYLSLLRWTATALHDIELAPGPRPRVPCLALPPSGWILQVANIETHFRRAVGSAQNLTECANRLGQRWLVGIAFARALAQTQESEPRAP